MKEKMINKKTTKEYIKLKNEMPLRNAKNSITMNALHLAVEKGNMNDISEVYEYEHIEVLGYYKRTLKINETNLKKTSLHIALYNGYSDIAKLLLSHKIELKNEIKERLYKSYSISKEKEIIEEKTPLYIAIQTGSNEIIKYMLSNCNIDVNENIITDELNEEEEDITPQTTALFASVEKENTEIVRFLLSFPNIDVNVCQNGKKTALHLAVEKGNIEIIKLLLTNQKIDINAYCKYKQINDSSYEEIDEKKTPLFLAVEKENIEIIKIKYLLNFIY